VAFCQWLSEKEGRRYRLPTEAEWEYACRAGTRTLYAMGDDPADLTANSRTLDPAHADVQQHVHQLPISPGGPIAFTCPVGQFAANRFGLHDMHGNVWEWTADWHGDDYYAHSPLDDPPGPPETDVRVRRGGAWNSFPLWARSSFRNWNMEDARCLNLGFRVAAE
jgi:sulfatase modifying factor 1